MKIAISAAVLVLFASFVVKRQAKGKPEELAKQAAESWLTLMDAGKYGDSWNQAAQVFKVQIKKGQWETTARFPQTGLSKASGEYRDSQYGVSLSVPPWWWFTAVRRWGDHENTLQLWEQGSQARAALYYKIFTTPQQLTPNETDKQLLRQITAKARQRKREGLEDYHVRENSYEQRMVNGRPAISWVGDYTEHGKNGKKKNMSEYLVRVRSDKVNALFFASMPTEELDHFREDFDNVIETLEIP
jgi:hypothetical protein